MDNSKTCEKPKDVLPTDNSEPSSSLPTELIDKIRKFIALANNHVMSVPVEGDAILRSAEVMNKAQEIFKELKVATDE